MTIQQYEQRAEMSLATTQDVAVTRLGEWAHSAEAAHQVATTLVQTSFCPDQFRNKPGEATAAILAGMEVGLQPMAALRSFDIIQGQAAPRAITLRAIVQSQGHEMVLMESTSTRCRMKGKRRGSNEWSAVIWTIDRARDLNLTNKSNWKQQPAAMLVARATSELARLIASDAILGLPYSAEEVADGGVDDQVSNETLEVTEAPRRTMSRNTVSGPAEAPTGDTVATASDAVVEPTHAAGSESPLLTNTTKFGKAFYARMKERSFESDQARLEYVCETVGRFVESTKELTEREAALVLARLDEDDAATSAVDAEVVA